MFFGREGKEEGKEGEGKGREGRREKDGGRENGMEKGGGRERERERNIHSSLSYHLAFPRTRHPTFTFLYYDESTSIYIFLIMDFTPSSPLVFGGFLEGGEGYIGGN